MIVQKQSLSEQARNELLRRIVTGELATGSRLTEESLSAEFAISRTPVRDALSRLEADGLVERLPARGYQVKKLTRSDVQQLLQCRMQIELMILRNDYTGLDGEALRTLQTELQNCDPDSPDAPALARTLDDRLHGIISAACSNRFTREIHRKLLQQRLPYRDLRNSPDGESAAELKQERLQLIEALLSGDPDRAYAALARHLQKGIDSIVEVMKDV